MIVLIIINKKDTFTQVKIEGEIIKEMIRDENYESEFSHETTCDLEVVRYFFNMVSIR